MQPATGSLELALIHKLIQSRTAHGLLENDPTLLERDQCESVHDFLQEADSKLDAALSCLHTLLTSRDLAEKEDTVQDLDGIYTLAKIALTALATMVAHLAGHPSPSSQSSSVSTRQSDISLMVDTSALIALRVLYKINNAAMRALSANKEEIPCVSSERTPRSAVRQHANALADSLLESETLTIQVKLLSNGHAAFSTAVNNLCRNVFSALQFLERTLVNKFLCSLTTMLDDHSLRSTLNGPLSLTACSLVSLFIDSAPSSVWKHNNLAWAIFEQIATATSHELAGEKAASMLNRQLASRRGVRNSGSSKVESKRIKFDSDVTGYEVTACRLLQVTRDVSSTGSTDDTSSAKLDVTVEVTIAWNDNVQTLRGRLFDSIAKSPSGPFLTEDTDPPRPPSSAFSSKAPKSIFLPSPSRVTLPSLQRMKSPDTSSTEENPHVITSINSQLLPPTAPLTRAKTLTPSTVKRKPAATSSVWRSDEFSGGSDDGSLGAGSVLLMSSPPINSSSRLARRHSSVVPRRPPAKSSTVRLDRLAAAHVPEIVLSPKPPPSRAASPSLRQRSPAPQKPIMSRSPVRAPVGRMFDAKRSEVINVAARRIPSVTNSTQRKISLFSEPKVDHQRTPSDFSRSPLESSQTPSSLTHHRALTEHLRRPSDHARTPSEFGRPEPKKCLPDHVRSSPNHRSSFDIKSMAIDQRSSLDCRVRSPVQMRSSPVAGLLRGDSSTADGSISYAQLSEPVLPFGQDAEDCDANLITCMVTCLSECCQAPMGRSPGVRKAVTSDAIPESFDVLKQALRAVDPCDPALPLLENAKHKGGQWLAQFHTLSLLRRVAIHHPAQLERHDALSPLFLLLARSADSLRTSVARQALAVVTDFYATANVPFKRLLDLGIPHLLPACLRKSADQTNLFLAEAAALAVRAIVCFGTETICLSVIRSVVIQAKHSLLRAQLLRATQVLVSRCGPKLVGVSEVDKLIAFAVKSLRDAATDSRHEAKVLCKTINEAFELASSSQVARISTKVRPEEWQRLRSLM